MPHTDRLPSFAHQAFGLLWKSDLPLTAFEPVEQGDIPADITATQMSSPPPPREISFATEHLGRAGDGLRYTDADVATIDTFGVRHIHIHPGSAWKNELPPAFFGTVTGLLLAWRGLLPIHGSAVEIDGRAVLLCGPGGAGKSTLAAALIAQGARLISDDLSILHPSTPDHPASFYAGRRALRLFDSTAGRLGRMVAWSAPPVVADRKLAVTPPRVDPRQAFPLSTILLIGEGHSLDTQEARAAALVCQMYRPKWLRTIPGQGIREAALAYLSRDLSILRAPSVDVKEDTSFYQLGKSTLDVIRSQLPR